MRRKIRDGLGTLSLLYQIDRSAFLIGTGTSVIQSLVYPLILVIVWRAFSLLMEGSGGGRNLAQQATMLMGTLFGLLALQTVLQVVNQTAVSILRAESEQQINARIMSKMSEVPYRLFEDNAFQARYGLLISQASHRPGMLVESFVGSVGALGSALAIAATLMVLSPVLVIFLLVLIPIAVVESRYHMRVVELHTSAAPTLFRMMYLTQRSIDATWQRDIRVHNSTILNDEYRLLAQSYLGNLKHLLRRYQLIRVGVGMSGAAVMTLAMGAVFWHISRSPAGLAEGAVVLPALIMGLNQGRAFAASWGLVTECLGYLTQIFEFFNESFGPSEVAGPPPVPPRATPVRAPGLG
jgi:ABC-type multidrug transport system fused ATPase/permease subunit